MRNYGYWQSVGCSIRTIGFAQVCACVYKRDELSLLYEQHSVSLETSTGYTSEAGDEAQRHCKLLGRLRPRGVAHGRGPRLAPGLSEPGDKTGLRL